MLRFFRDFAELAVLAAVALGVAFWLGTTMCPDQPTCPTEDSCAVDYRDGAWHIEEDAGVPVAGVAVPVEGTPDYVG